MSLSSSAADVPRRDVVVLSMLNLHLGLQTALSGPDTEQNK